MSLLSASHRSFSFQLFPFISKCSFLPFRNFEFPPEVPLLCLQWILLFSYHLPYITINVSFVFPFSFGCLLKLFSVHRKQSAEHKIMVVHGMNVYGVWYFGLIEIFHFSDMKNEVRSSPLEDQTPWLLQHSAAMSLYSREVLTTITDHKDT